MNRGVSLFFALFVSLMFIGIGIFFIVAGENAFPTFSKGMRFAFGILLIGYGLFRAFYRYNKLR